MVLTAEKDHLSLHGKKYKHTERVAMIVQRIKCFYQTWWPEITEKPT